MYCQRCGTENPEEAKFCKDCGISLVLNSYLNDDIRYLVKINNFGGKRVKIWLISLFIPLIVMGFYAIPALNYRNLFDGYEYYWHDHYDSSNNYSELILVDDTVTNTLVITGSLTILISIIFFLFQISKIAFYWRARRCIRNSNEICLTSAVGFQSVFLLVNSLVVLSKGKIKKDIPLNKIIRVGSRNSYLIIQLKNNNEILKVSHPEIWEEILRNRLL